MQLRLEGKALVDEHFLRQVEVLPDEEMPLLLIAQPANQALVAYYEGAIFPDLQEKLAANLFEEEFPDLDSVRNVLCSHGFSFEVGHYKTYVFPSRLGREAEVICFPRQDPSIKAFGFDGFTERVYAIELDGKIVSACVSVRENESCGEAWVYTEEAYRHQGFARKVVKAWAESLMGQGKVPFYSHKIENVASANLAKKLGLQTVFDEVAILKSS